MEPYTLRVSFQGWSGSLKHSFPFVKLSKCPKHDSIPFQTCVALAGDAVQSITWAPQPATALRLGPARIKNVFGHCWAWAAWGTDFDSKSLITCMQYCLWALLVASWMRVQACATMPSFSFFDRLYGPYCICAGTVCYLKSTVPTVQGRLHRTVQFWCTSAHNISATIMDE